MSEEEYNLKESIKKFGVLVPIIKDKEGNIIDGLHRSEIEPNAPTFIINLKKPEDRVLARLVINLHRRKLTSQDKTMLLGEIAEATGWKSQEIADALSMTKQWVLKYLPEQYKNREMVELGELASESKKKRDLDVGKQRLPNHVSQDIPVRPNGLTTCEIGMHLVDPSKAKNINGHIVCEAHEPIGKTRFKTKEEKPLETKEYKPTETWEYRKAVMTPQHSSMEEQVLTLLIEKGVKNIVQDREFCLLSTKPDLYFAKENAAVYLDGKDTHMDRTDRDEKLREMLEHKGVKVYSITYDSTGKKETMEIVDQILEWLGKS
jgi:hypothetical protein